MELEDIKPIQLLKQQIFDACKKSDLKFAKSFLFEKKMHTNFKINMKKPICCACKAGNIELVDLMLSCGEKD